MLEKLVAAHDKLSPDPKDQLGSAPNLVSFFAYLASRNYDKDYALLVIFTAMQPSALWDYDKLDYVFNSHPWSSD